MTSSPHQESNGPEPAKGSGLPLILALDLVGSDPVSGTVGIAGGPPAIPFRGWIDLMSAINTLRAAAGKTA